MKYHVGDLRFVRKEDVDLYTIDLRNRYKPNLRVVGADADFLKALLTSHPESSQKFSKLIEGFSVGTNRHGTWSIFIEYQDGSRDDLALRNALQVFAQQPTCMAEPPTSWLAARGPVLPRRGTMERHSASLGPCGGAAAMCTGSGPPGGGG